MTEIKGTDFKYKFTSTGAFSLDEHEWEIAFSVNGVSATITKKNAAGGGYTLTCDRENFGAKPLGDNAWIFLLDSSIYGKGRILATLSAHIPDADFDPDEAFPTLDGIRTEIRKYWLDSVE